MSQMPHDVPIPAPMVAPLAGRARLGAYLNMTFVDHGFIRTVYCNVHRASPAMWRAAQPLPRHLRWAKAKGVRTVLNLRGRREACGSYRIEREVCAKLGLSLVDFRVRSREMPARGTLHAARELFRTIEYPVLMHCKSGSDRAGFMSAFYLHLHEGVPFAAAIGQLSLRYGHVARGRTGMLDYFFERYRQDTGGDAARFDDWLDRVYDPAAFTESFRDSKFANFLIDRILGRE